MGQGSSTAAPPPAHPTPEELAAQEERIKRVMQEAYMKGMEDANLVATQRLAEMQSQFIIATTIGAILSGGATAYYFRNKATQSAQEFTAAKEAATAVTLAKENEIVLERARVSELSAVCESQKNMLDSQQQLLRKTNQQYNMAVARCRLIKVKYTKLLAKHGPLSVEVRNLREANGVLNQKFMMATAGAISLGMLAGALIIMNHHSGGEHVSVPVSVEVEVPAVGEHQPPTPSAPTTGSNHNNNHNHNDSVVRHNKSTNIPTQQPPSSPHVRVSSGAQHEHHSINKNYDTFATQEDNDYNSRTINSNDRGVVSTYSDEVDTLPSNPPSSSSPNESDKSR